MINVAIIDDHVLFAKGLERIINETCKVKVTGIAHTGSAGIRLLKMELPDVLLLDISLPDTDGITLCGEIKKLFPTLKILALTSYSEYTMVRRMMESGASGYVLKNALAEEMLEGIQTVAEGETFLCHEIDVLMKKDSNPSIWLTPTERKLLKLIVDGFTNPEIAEKMFLSVESINTYRKKLLFKLGARNTAVLVRIAIEEKLV